MKRELLFGIVTSIGMMVALVFGATLQQLLVALSGCLFLWFLQGVGKQEKNDADRDERGEGI